MMNGESGVVLCARERHELVGRVEHAGGQTGDPVCPWLASNFDIGEKYIRTIDKSVNYVFCGLRHNLDSIKSKARILLCWGRG